MSRGRVTRLIVPLRARLCLEISSPHSSSLCTSHKAMHLSERSRLIYDCCITKHKKEMKEIQPRKKKNTLSKSFFIGRLEMRGSAVVVTQSRSGAEPLVEGDDYPTANHYNTTLSSSWGTFSHTLRLLVAWCSTVSLTWTNQT